MTTNTKVASRVNDLGALVDQLGKLKAKIAALCEQEKAIKDELVLSRLPNIDGSLFRATISTGERCTLDTELVKTLLTPDQVLQCTKVTEVISVRVNARIKVV